jgi:hypothetical protein
MRWAFTSAGLASMALSTIARSLNRPIEAIRRSRSPALADVLHEVEVGVAVDGFLAHEHG